MKLKVIENPNPPQARSEARSAVTAKGSFFKRREFSQIATLFSQAATHKALYNMAIDVSEDQKYGSITLHRSAHCPGFLQLHITKFSPKSVMYEVFTEKGRVAKSGSFIKAFEKISEEVGALMPSPL